MSTAIDTNKGRYLPLHIQLVLALIAKNGGLHEGDECPVCKQHFRRWLHHVETDSKAEKFSGSYLLMCDGCGFAVRDVWTMKEEWEP